MKRGDRVSYVAEIHRNVGDFPEIMGLSDSDREASELYERESEVNRVPEICGVVRRRKYKDLR